ncbi:hypothetical protein [Phyllobacterium sp. UNC302MFCol5.2]|uniref:hypothetical protein n=1 Tax=Phyllobacterium sp. UNC302MFCol5.2 TaxID=1449065 RepID=UPI0004847A4C|nr:hypothetical protein [Phyllobacterium sp. UNC302MFCol5.2]
MKALAPIIAAAALAFAPGIAFAACPTTTGSINSDAKPGIAQDGTHVPLENSGNSTIQKGAASTGTTTNNSPQTAQKDGQTMPLAGTEGAGDKNLATSAQDVQAQQKGEPTAMAKAEDCKN